MPSPAQVRRPQILQLPAGECELGDVQCIEMHKRQAKAWNKDRHAEMKRDAERLFQLATELKQSVDKTDENMLSLEVMKKAEEIEKLAKNVKNKMKGY